MQRLKALKKQKTVIELTPGLYDSFLKIALLLF